MKRRHYTLVWGAVVLVGATVAGCCRHLSHNWGEPPGTISYQRSRAVIHDPFPDNSIGPPVLGGRPLGYEYPLAEPAKAQEASPRR